MIPVTIYDVARQAGVSIKTVSRVMNDEPKVGPVLRAKIKAIAEELGYSPNRSARSLAGSKSFVLAAFVDADLTLDHWGDERATDYLTRVQYGATLSCRQAGYHLVLQLIDHDPSMVRQQVQAVLGALKPDGVILTPPSSDNELVLTILRQSGTPFVRLGPERDLGGGLRIELDDSGAAAHMTARLITLGHRRIGFVAGDPLFSSSRARLAGYRMAMAAGGLAIDPEWEQQGAYTYRSGHLAARALLALSQRPTAIFASSDDMALGCLAAADEAGLIVPEELSIVGFDDSTVARFSRPRLTTMRQPLVAMARTAANALIRGAVTPICNRTLALDLVDDFEFIERESSGPAPGVGRSEQRRAAAGRASPGRTMKRSGPLEEEGAGG